MEGRRWLAADGRYNLPDGEVFTSPLETETEGEIRYTFPAVYHGREVEDVRLRFEAGRVVAAEAARGDDYLQSLLDMDAGLPCPRRGRVRAQLRDRPLHAQHPLRREDRRDDAPRAGVRLPAERRSEHIRLHWDMICDLRREGEVYADGELIWKNGQFLAEPALEVVESGHGHELPSDELQQAGTPGRRPRRLLHQVREGDLVCVDTGPRPAPIEAVWRRVLEAEDTRIFGWTLTGPPSSCSGRGRTSSRAGSAHRGGPKWSGRRGIAIYADVNTRTAASIPSVRRAWSERTTRSGASTSRGRLGRLRTWSRSIRRRRRRRTPTCHSPSTRTSSSAPASSTTTTRAGSGRRAAGRRPAGRRARTKRRARIVGDGTDLTLGVEGRTWVPSDGRENFPDGEVFTGPIETRVEGTISFTYPSSYAGRRISGVRLEFRGGEVVRADAEEG